jgi:hypothetical protein
MKKKKLTLKNLEVQSFVTSGENLENEVKGGGTLACLNSNYPTMPCNCSAVDACLTAWNCTPNSQTCLNNSNYPTMPCNCSAFDACLTAWNCTVEGAC